MRLTSGGIDSVFDQLDRRLARAASWPVAVAVSGGSDSLALLHLAADWAARRHRRLLALSVDHRLNPDAAAWNARVHATARQLNVDWRGLVWLGDKPATGLPAAARRARHSLLAEAARAAGARVILLGHTADDVAEGDWMRDRGTPLGHIRDWGPSPVWPEGRGLMLLRPLLDVSRRDLRDWLRRRGHDWVEDPANIDPRFQRTLARAAGPVARAWTPSSEPALDLLCNPHTGVISGPVQSPWLGHAVASASGRELIPDTAAVARLRDLLARTAGTSTLSGARIQAEAGRMWISREAGRLPLADQPLVPLAVQIWDGRFEFLANEVGWRVGPAAGRRARLSRTDRAWLSSQPIAARGPHPVLIRESGLCPILADPAVEASCLVSGRLRLATRQVQTERDL